MQSNKKTKTKRISKDHKGRRKKVNSQFISPADVHFLVGDILSGSIMLIVAGYGDKSSITILTLQFCSQRTDKRHRRICICDRISWNLDVVVLLR